MRKVRGTTALGRPDHSPETDSERDTEGLLIKFQASSAICVTPATHPQHHLKEKQSASQCDYYDTEDDDHQQQPLDMSTEIYEQINFIEGFTALNI